MLARGDNMLYRRRRILLAEIDRQCSFALIAYGDATAALQKRDADRLWYSLEALVTAASRLQHLLWPSNASLAWAVELRGALGVPDDSPLRRGLTPVADLVATIESWNLLRPGQPPVLSNIGSGGATAQEECVRCFDPEGSRFTLFGTVFELPPLLNAMVQIGQQAKQELQNLRALV